ncbi:MAG: tetratricopeptide repeat protein [Elusimicrobia bacterium]|nr:tetratricopeptide repeat protein [Elusimicrobiota bacterium]
MTPYSSRISRFSLSLSLAACLWLCAPSGALGVEPDGSYRILCAGDGFVWGMGGRRFPDWLGEVLRKKYPGLKFSVATAWTGNNSVGLVRSLPSLLKEVRPDVLIVLSGGSNHWDTIGAPRDARKSFLGWSAVPENSAGAVLSWSDASKDASAGDYKNSLLSGCDPERQAEGYNNLPSRRAKPWYEFDDSTQDKNCGANADAAALSDLYLAQADIFMRMRGPARAETSARCAAGITPSSADAQYYRSFAFQALLDCSWALKSAGKAASLSPDYEWLPDYSQAWRLQSLGSYDRAADLYRKALAASPERPEISAELCSALCGGGDYSAAVKTCAAGLKKFPGDDSLLLASIRAFSLKGDYSRAFELLLSADSRPQDLREDCYRAFYGTLAEAGESDDAADYAARHVKALKGDRLPQLFLARLYAAAKNFPLERDSLKDARRAAPDLPEILLMDGDSAQRACDYPAAEELYARAMSAAPGFWGGPFALGDLAGRRGDYQKAKQLLEKALALAPSERRIYRQLGRVLWRIGDLPGALENYRKALLLDPQSEDTFKEMSDMALDGGRRAEELAALASEVPGLSANPEYQAFLRERKGDSAATALDGELQSSLEKDILSVCSMARDSEVPLVLGSYPDKSMPGTAAAAKACGARYVDFNSLFRRQFKRRADYIAYDNDHPNSAGYRFMAEQYAVIVGSLLQLEDVMDEDFQ